MMDALIKHLLGLVQSGMTDVGEVLDVMVRLEPDDEECWIKEWSVLAQRLQERAEKAHAAGRDITAASAFLRASTYWRASLMYFSLPEDPRIRINAEASARCYALYLAVSGYPGEFVKIPYEGGFLPGHFYRSPVAGENAPLLILTPGRDTWAEDTRWVYDNAVRRGVHCLVYDGPGQGFTLRLQGLPFRPDWEAVLGPVVDFALGLPGVDPDRIGLMGMSFGGFLSIRAAAFDKRIKLCITDPGSISWGRGIINHLPEPVRDIVLGDGPLRGPTIWAMDKTPLNWLIRDYAWKHAVPHEEVFRTLLDYDNTAVLSQIECKTLVIDGAAEMSPGEARKLFDALDCPKDYLLFDEDTTAQAHCQMGGYATGAELLFDWIDENL
ncbi:alpha/beta hydrolase family protein [Brevundimonas sp. FT23042]|uniref:alpha/beta hydrolase family protein n=1 Tax=Brevundimonas sp. FT23042 TaxID=3393749 RepID=UPI003B586F15